MHSPVLAIIEVSVCLTHAGTVSKQCKLKKIDIFWPKVLISQKRHKVGPRLPLITNRKLTCAKINNLGWPWTAIMKPTTKIWTKIDPYYWQTVVSGNIRFMQIFTRVPWRGASNNCGVVDNGYFQHFCRLYLRNV